MSFKPWCAIHNTWDLCQPRRKSKEGEQMRGALIAELGTLLARSTVDPYWLPDAFVRSRGDYFDRVKAALQRVTDLAAMETSGAKP